MHNIILELSEKFNFDLIIANNGKEGIEKLYENNVDIILMDIAMPIMNGYEATTIIKKDEKYKHIPVIALTAFARPEDKDLCLTSGCDAYISKPVDVYILIEKIHEMLKK